MGGHVFLVVMCFIGAHTGSSVAELKNCTALTSSVQNETDMGFTFTVTDGCVKDVVFINVFTPTSRLYCHFTHNQSACVRSNRPDACVCDPKTRSYSVVKDLSGLPEDRTGWLLKGASNTPSIRILFQETVNLPIKHSPEVYDIQVIGDRRLHEEELEVNEHSSLKLICSWNPGRPPKAAQLFKDGVLLIRQQPTTSQMTNHIEFAINDIGCQDGGIYSCEAAGAVKNKSIQVTVPCTETTHRYSTEGPTEFASEPWYGSEESRQATAMQGVVEPDHDKSPQMEEKSLFDVDTITIYISFGCIAFLLIVIAILCGVVVVVRRKVSTPAHPPPAPVPDENVIELQQLPATQGAGSRVSILSYASDIYQEIEDSSSDEWPESEFESESQSSARAAPREGMTDTDARTKRLILEQIAANNRRRARHCRPPLKGALPVPDSAHSASAVKLPVLSDSDYFHPTASENEKAHSSKVDCTSISQFSTDSDGYMQPRPAVLPPRPALKMPVLPDSDYFHPTASEEEKARSSKVDCTCFQEDVEGAAGGVCPHMARLCNPHQQSLGTDRVLSSISQSSTDSDGYMLPRPAVLPPRSPLNTAKRLAPPIHQRMLSDRLQGKFNTSNSSANTASGETCPSRRITPLKRSGVSGENNTGETCRTRRPTPFKRSGVSGDNTASGETNTGSRSTPLKRSVVSGASAKPQPHEGDVLEDASGGYMCTDNTSAEYMLMTRPKTITSATQSHSHVTTLTQSHSALQTNVTGTHEPVAYANTETPSDSPANAPKPLEQDGPKVRKHSPFAPRHDDGHPYENIDKH